jgi:hypothetical protein
MRMGMRRWGLGIERRPAADLGLPSTSLPPTWVIERRTWLRRALRSTTSMLRPVSSPNRIPV